jgi:NAD(P)-dependent dehydrogenase (short-subunit alcohol dehydrogenase family)
MRDTDRSGPLENSLAKTGVRDQVEIGRLDVTDAASIREAVATTLSRTGGQLDAIVHNAGIAVGAAFEDLPDAEGRRVMETNFFGVLALTRAVLPTFRMQRSGRIVIVSSDAAFFGQPANSIYSASKWALEGWAEGIAYELEMFGIEIVLVEPGPYRTDIWERSTRISPADSAYRLWLQQLLRAVDEHARSAARSPVEVAEAIANALEVRRPRFRYPVGPIAHLHHALRGKVPTRLLRKAVTWYLGLDRTPR